MAVGKDTNISPIDGNILAFVLIAPSVILLILGFAKLPHLAAYIAYIIVSVLNCVMAFGIKAAIAIKVNEMINSSKLNFGNFLGSTIKINIKIGFILYIAISALLLAAGILSLAVYSHKSRGMPPSLYGRFPID